MAKKSVKITETVLRDGQQSLAATRMRIVDMLPILEKMDSIGYHAIEAWGGATFDVCLRFLNEDPLAAAPSSQKESQNPDPDAASRAKPSRLSSHGR